MRIIRFIAHDGRIVHGEDHPDGSVTVQAGSVMEGFQRTDQQAKIARLLAPIEPPNVICIGRNYRAHSEAASDESPRRQGAGGVPPSSDSSDAALEVFLKPTTAIQNPGDPILMPRFAGLDPQLDCEGELAVVIGRTARDVSEADALDHVFGYTIANDVTARCFQTPTGPPIWMRGKGFDTFCPLGPAIVTADEMPRPTDVEIRTIVNGRWVRDGGLAQMSRTIPEVISQLSRRMTLRPGTVILTGAPPLIEASARSPSLKPGDEITVFVSGIGSLTNFVRDVC